MKYNRNTVAEGCVGMSLSRTLLYGLPMVLAVSASQASQVDYMTLTLEEPAMGAVATGVANLRGWAVGKFGVERVDYFIDDPDRVRSIPYGGKRGDVGSKFDYQGDVYSGFSMAFNYNNLEPGEHSITVRAWDFANDHVEVVHTFNVVRFGDNTFIAGEDALDLGMASAAIDGNDVLLYNGIINEQPYNMTLHWSQPSQKPEIVDISPFDISSMVDANGTWNIEFTTDASDCGNGAADTLNVLIPVSSNEYTLNLNGLELVFSGVNPDTLGIQFEGIQGDSLGDILWDVEVLGGTMMGAGSQLRPSDCTVVYGLSGTKP